MRPNFSAERAFNTLAVEQVRFEGTASIDFITYRDLNLLMEKHNHNNSLEQLDLRLLIERFDKDNDGKIGKNEVSIKSPFSHFYFWFSSWIGSTTTSEEATSESIVLTNIFLF